MRSDSRRFEAIGTQWQVDTDRPLSAAEWQAVDDRIEDFDRTYSRFRADSLVTKVASGTGTFAFPADVLPLVSFYRQLYEFSAGAVSPLVGGALEDLGYDAAYRLTPNSSIRSTSGWDEAMSWDGSMLTTTEPLTLDFGAAGKGYLVDILGGMLESFDVQSYLVDASGDLKHSGPDSIRVGLEHPGDDSLVIGVVPLGNAALAASATNRRSWGAGLHHILDPRTGRPVDDIIASWVIADSAMVADGLATLLFFTDGIPEAPLSPSETPSSWLRVNHAGSAQWSANFQGELFS